MDQDGFRQVNNKKGGSRRSGNGGYDGQGGGQNPGYQTCTICGWPDHTAQYCPRNAQNTGGFGAGRGAGRGSGTCYRCDLPGHFARDCNNAPAGPRQSNQPGRAFGGANIPTGPRQCNQPGRAFGGANAGKTFQKKPKEIFIYEPADNEFENAANGYEELENAYIGELPNLGTLSLGDSNKEDPENGDSKGKGPAPEGSKRDIAGHRYPLRPAYGKKGTPVTLRTNYFDVMVDSDLTIGKYSVAVIPAEGAKEPTGKSLERVVELLLRQHFEELYDDIATDYRSTLLTRHRLMPDGDTADFDVAYSFEDPPEDAPDQDLKIYKVRVSAVKVLKVAPLLEHLQSSSAGASFEGKDEIIQAMNIIFGAAPKGDPEILTVGANKHFWKQTEDYTDLGKGLLAMRGYSLSVRPAVSRLLLNVQVKHVACYVDGPLGNLMRQHGLQDVEGLSRFLKGVRFRPTHLESSGPPKRIYGVARSDDGLNPNKPMVSFNGAGPKDVRFYLTREDGSAGYYISVYDYFASRYPHVRLDTRFPVINYGSKDRPRYLPAEACEVLACQPCNSKLDPQQTSQMIGFAVRNPCENAKSIVDEGLQVCSAVPDVNDILSRMKVSVLPNLVLLNGRVLQAPNLHYPGSTVSPRAGSWDTRRLKRMGRAMNWPLYAILNLCGGHQQSLPGRFNPLFTQAQSWGITCGQPLGTYSCNIDWRGDIKGQAENHLSEVAKQCPNAKMVFVILPDVNTQLYNGIKRKGDIDLGIHTVCVVGPQPKKLYSGESAYMANVLTKLNLKLGGTNQTLSGANQLGIISEGKTMVVGIDVTHPSPGSSTNAPSIAGMVASVDSTLSQWPATLRVQSVSRNEIVGDLRNMLISRLALWKAHNKDSLPANILVYRDGVSEGQYNIVIDEELPQLQEACNDMYPPGQLPKISIIVVGKRHNTRFYPTSKEQADSSSNAPAGTIVDRCITQPRNWDFFLQSHTALKGTAKSAHYFVVYDEIFRSKHRPAGSPSAADEVEDLTHNMCYLFGRATKAVSVCPPAYYADLVCDRARCYLSGLFDGSNNDNMSQADLVQAIEIHENVRNSMFYI